MEWWENTFTRTKDGKLRLHDNTPAELVDLHGAPLFVYSLKQILTNLENLRLAFSSALTLPTRICYALKANPHPEILNLLQQNGAWIDAVSPAEAEAALKAGFSGDKILYTGTSVSAEDLRRVFAIDQITVNIDAPEQLLLMRDLQEREFPRKSIRVAVRWNPGLGRGFSPKAITAGSGASGGIPVKFGVEDAQVLPIFSAAREYGFLPVGLHQHLGSGWVKNDFAGVIQAVDRFVHKAVELKQNGFPLEFLDFGGGFGPRYAEKDEIFPIAAYAAHIQRRIAESDLDLKAVAIEPGKYLVGDAGILLLQVEYTKQSYGNHFVCVNGGTFNTVPRPAIYTQAQHHILNCRDVSSGPGPIVTVAGNLCETGDVFHKGITMPLARRGDVLALLCAGAYCHAMASHYNMRPIPKEIIL